MTGARRLYELQNTDLMLEDNKRVLSQLSNEIGDDSDVLRIKEKIDQLKESLRELKEEQREADDLVSGFYEKVQTIENVEYLVTALVWICVLINFA